MPEQGGPSLDAIARDLANGAISRRTALRRFGGVALGTLLPGALFADSALARCPKSRRCDGKCCPAHARCAQGKCKCDHGFTKCGTTCRNLTTDEDNCGSCGHRCPTGNVCQNGHCQPANPATCGDGVKNGSEQCDGSDLGGQTCQTQGFYDGTLACSPDCQSFDTSGCYANPCDPNPCIPAPSTCQGGTYTYYVGNCIPGNGGSYTCTTAPVSTVCPNGCTTGGCNP